MWQFDSQLSQILTKKIDGFQSTSTIKQVNYPVSFRASDWIFPLTVHAERLYLRHIYTTSLTSRKLNFTENLLFHFKYCTKLQRNNFHVFFTIFSILFFFKHWKFLFSFARNTRLHSFTDFGTNPPGCTILWALPQMINSPKIDFKSCDSSSTEETRTRYAHAYFPSLSASGILHQLRV